MENRNLILMLLEKSINAFGRVLGLSEEDKLKAALLITQSTIQDSFDINSIYLSEKTLEDILAKTQLNLDQAQLLTNLLWTQAEILLKLNRKEDCLKQYLNTVQLLKWKEKQSFEKGQLERERKIIEIESIIAELKST
jgi:hypothetical protein